MNIATCTKCGKPIIGSPACACPERRADGSWEEEKNTVRRVYKYATGQNVPAGAKYLFSCKNGLMDKDSGYEFVWHYFLVEVDDEKSTTQVAR